MSFLLCILFLSSIARSTCPLGPNLLSVEMNTAVSPFVASGSYLPDVGFFSECSNNGQCNNGTICECNGNWGGLSCSWCNVSYCSFGGYCFFATGECVYNGQVPINDTDSLYQGTLHVFVSTKWWNTAPWTSYATTMSFNNSGIGRLLSYSSQPMQCVNSSDPRLKPINVSKYSNCSEWLYAVLGANVAYFVFYNDPSQDFLHCDEVVGGYSRCQPDQHDVFDNFFATSGFYEIELASDQHVLLRQVRSSPTGCSWGTLSNGTVAMCSRRGVCDADTQFTCQCRGNFSGPGCESCNCHLYMHCHEASGMCLCNNGFELCSGVCVDVTSDVANCNECGSNCYQHAEAAVERAWCTARQCHWVMKNPLSWSRPGGRTTAPF